MKVVVTDTGLLLHLYEVGVESLLAHMGECLARIADYTQNQRRTFTSSIQVQDAAIRNLQVLTESSQRLSAEIKLTEPSVPWRELAGFRNIIVHGYLGVDLDAIWLVIERDLPPLAEAVQRMALRCPAKD